MTFTPVRLDIRKIGGRIGAEITGLDLNAPRDEETVAELGAAHPTVPSLDGNAHVLPDEAGHYTPKAA